VSEEIDAREIDARGNFLNKKMVASDLRVYLDG
jgi:hypothetical protein